MLPPAHIAANYIIINNFKKINNKKRFLYLSFGSILPDLIDKPLGYIIYHSFGNGRLYAHTLIFNLFVILVCIYIGGFNGDPIIIGVCSLLHLVEDEMWKMPKVLFYPFLGAIPKRPCMSFNKRIETILSALHNPFRLAINIIGILLILVYITYTIIKKSEKETD